MKITNKLLISLLSCSFVFALTTTSYTSVKAEQEYNFREDSSITEVIYHEVDGENDEIVSKEIYNRDDSGKLISMISYDYEDGNYVESYKEEYTYDAAGRQTLMQEYNYDSEKATWSTSWADENIYDEKGNEIKHGSFKWNDQGEKLYSSYYLVEYNEKGLVTKETSYSSDYEDPTKCTTNHYGTYEYNESNQLIKYTYYSNSTYNDPSTSYLDHETIYTYAPNGKCASEDDTYYNSEGTFQYCYYDTYEYDDQNRILKHTNFLYQASNHQDLDDVDQYRYTYTGDEVKYDHYICNDCEDGYKEEDFKYDSTRIEIDTKEEYKYVQYYLDEEGKTVYNSYCSHVTREYEDGYLALEKQYEFDKEGNETLSGYTEIKTKRVAKEQAKKFPYWVIPTGSVVVLIGAYTCGYFFFYEKGKLSGKFFDTIYTWFKKLLAKLTKKK